MAVAKKTSLHECTINFKRNVNYQYCSCSTIIKDLNDFYAKLNEEGYKISMEF